MNHPIFVREQLSSSDSRDAVDIFFLAIAARHP